MAGQLEDEQVGGLELLSDQERQAVVGLVEALVDQDESALRAVDAFAGGSDPYEPTRRWRLWPKVDLVVPPGNPVAWEANVCRAPDRGWSVAVRMWTVQEEGPSDLILHLDVAGPRLLYRGMWT